MVGSDGVKIGKLQREKTKIFGNQWQITHRRDKTLRLEWNEWATFRLWRVQTVTSAFVVERERKMRFNYGNDTNSSAPLIGRRRKNNRSFPFCRWLAVNHRLPGTFRHPTSGGRKRRKFPIGRSKSSAPYCWSYIEDLHRVVKLWADYFWMKEIPLGRKLGCFYKVSQMLQHNLCDVPADHLTVLVPSRPCGAH